MTTEIDTFRGKLLSIVIPCFNVERYVVESLDSVIQQIDSSVELILINDGSTDQTLALLRKFVAHNQGSISLKLIDQSNAGLSAARNAGIAVASGEYVAFLDSDDRWSDGAWATLRPLLADKSYDLIEFEARKFVDASMSIREGNDWRHGAMGLVAGDCAYGEADFDRLKMPFTAHKWFVWSRVYKRSVIDGLLFEVGRRFEDTMFTPYAYLRAKRIYSSTFELVMYRYNPESISNNMREADTEDMLYCIRERQRVAEALEDAGGEKFRLLCLASALECSRILHRRAHVGVRSITTGQREVFWRAHRMLRYSDLSGGLITRIKICFALLLPDLAAWTLPALSRLKKQGSLQHGQH